MELTRRNFVSAIAFSASVIAAGAVLHKPQAAWADDRTHFGIGHLNSTAHVLAFVAKEEGYFDEEGIDAELTQFSSGSELVAGLESGKLQVALIGSVPTLVNQSTGHEISIIGGAMTNGHGIVIDPQYTEGLDSWDVTILKGRTVAVPRTTVQELETLQVLAEYGLTYAEDDSADVKIVYFASQSDAYNALASAEIDAVTTYSPYMSRAVEDGYSVVYSCSDEEIFENQPCCRQVALTSALEQDTAPYVAFERAIIRAWHFYRTEQEGTVADVHKYIPIDEELIDYELYSGEYADSNPDPDKQACIKLKESAVEFGYLEDYDIEPYFNTDIYAQALASIIEENPDDELYQELQKHFDEVE